jgi:hypothetical protein
MLIELIQKDLDEVPALRERMISALLIGGGVQVAEGQRTGGSFTNIPTCSAPGEVGCVIAYASYSKEAPPEQGSRFAARREPGKEMACTEPAALAGNGGPYLGSYFRAQVNNPAFRSDQPLPEGLQTPFAVYPRALQGECVRRDGMHYLEISLAQAASDARGIPPYRSKALEAVGFGLHVVDYNLTLEDLIAAVALQAKAAMSL